MQGHLLDDGVVHFLVEEPVAVAPRVLGPIHGHVRLAHQRPEIRAVLRIHRHADRNGDGHLRFIDPERFAKTLKKLAEESDHRVRFRQIGQQQKVLVAALTTDRIGASHLPFQALGDGDEHAVAGVVPEEIIDRLEAVNIEHHQRHLGSHPVGEGDRLLQTVLQQELVRQAGQGVVVGQEPGALLGQLAFGDVGKDPDAAFAREARIDRTAGQLAPERAAVGVYHHQASR
jgi:hypothetical protein